MKSQKIIVLIVSILFSGTAFLSTVYPVFAQPGITIVTADFPPFKFKVGEKIVGLDTEIILAVFDRMGYDVSVEMKPFLRADLETRKGNYAAYYTFTYNDDRGKDYLYTSPISAVQNVFFYDKSRLNDPMVQKVRDWKTLDFLKGLKVGLSANYNYEVDFMKLWRPAGKPEWNPNEPGFVRIFKAQEIVGTSPEKQHLMKLVRGRIHTFISEISVGNYYREQDLKRFGNITHAKRSVGKIRTFHMGFSKKWRGPNGEEPLALRDHFNFELTKFVQEGGRLPIYKKYGFVSPFMPKTNTFK
jgi:polar amino acid transport system substrate-binding protein